MDEMIQQVVQRTGIPEDKARMAVEVVVTQLRGRLPAPIASQLDGFIGGGGGSQGSGGQTGGIAGMAKGLGGMLGR